MHMEHMSSSIVIPLLSLWNVRDKLLTLNVILLFHAQHGWQRVLVLSDVVVVQVSVVLSLLFLSYNYHNDCFSQPPTLLFFFFFIYNTVHDPNISGPVDCPSWLPAATGNTNAQILIDRLAAQRVSIIFQKNFLIPQSIWENCRNEGSANSEWMDTYYLVCNYGIHSFLGRHVPSVRPIEKISHLQKLCMVHRIRSNEQVSSQLYRDYVFAPTHSIQSELCMILQTCYFYLPRIQYTSVSQVPAEAVVRQISLDEYREHTTPWSSSYIHAEQGNFVIVHEVAFAPKGQHDSNLSFWFNTPAIKLEASQIKRSRRLKQKKKAQIRNEHSHPNANGALISRTCSADFPNGDPDIR